MKQSIVFIAGPTAVGKSHVASLLAEALDGEIVSCDAMQVYSQINIASNKPTEQQIKDIKHHLLGVTSVYEEFDVVKYSELATEAIKNILANSKIPIVVGGSGMYMEALIDGVFQGPLADWNLREKLEKQAQDLGTTHLHKKLQEVDGVAAAKIHENDLRRIIRALEVYELTGKPISQWQKERSGLEDQYDIKMFALNFDRDLLYEKINARVDHMVTQGLVEEVQALAWDKISQTARRVIGLEEIHAYIAGKTSLEEALNAMKQNTRNYAKRQLTWLRRDPRYRWIDLKDDNALEIIMQALNV